MTSHTLRAHSPLIKGGQKGANIITDSVRKSLPAIGQEARKLEKVPPVIRDAVGGKALLDPGVVKIVRNLLQAWRRAA
jgi:hypothetical protein